MATYHTKEDLDYCMFQLEHLDFVYSKGNCFYNANYRQKELHEDQNACAIFKGCLQNYAEREPQCLLQLPTIENYDFYQVSICAFHTLELDVQLRYDFYQTYLINNSLIPFLKKNDGKDWTCLLTNEDWQKLFRRSCDHFHKSYCFKVEECLKKNMSMEAAVKSKVATRVR